MKNLKLTGLALCGVMLMAGCSEEELVKNSAQQEGNYTVTVTRVAESRTWLPENPVDNQYPTYWSGDDKIEVASADRKVRGVLSLYEGKDETNAQFSGLLNGAQSKLEYAVFPVPNSKGEVELTSRSYKSPNAPMIGTLNRQDLVNFENTCGMFRLVINNYPADKNLIVTAQGISGTAKPVKVGDKWDLQWTSDTKNQVTITETPSEAGTVVFYVPVITDQVFEGNPNNITPTEITVAVAETNASITKAIKIAKKVVSSSEASTFLTLTYHADTQELTEAWDGESTDTEIDFTQDIVEIHDAAGLKAFAEYVKAGNRMSKQTIILQNDIDLNGKEWTPIGEYGVGNTYFRGTFDGNGKTISNLKVTSDHAGLFGVLLGATIQNLTLENAVVTGTTYAGGIAGSCQSANIIQDVTMDNCTVNGNENSQTFIGGYASNGYAMINGVGQVNISTNLQSAISNAPEGSTIVLSEGGDYGTVTIDELKNVTIKGNEAAVMIFKTDADSKIENVTLQEIEFEYTGATADCGIVIDANAQIENLVIENCTFTGNGAKAGRGLSGYNNNASIIIRNSTFKDLGYPIYAWGGYESLTVENCDFENIKSWAIMPQSGFDGDLTVTDCNFINCLGGGLIKAGTLTAGHTFTFTDNTITGCTVAGDHNWFQFNVSAGTSVISGNKMDGAIWTPTTEDGLK